MVATSPRQRHERKSDLERRKEIAPKPWPKHKPLHETPPCAKRRLGHARCRTRGFRAARRRAAAAVYDRHVPAALEDTLISGFTRLATDAPHRRIDVELRTLDVVLATIFGLIALPF